MPAKATTAKPTAAPVEPKEDALTGFIKELILASDAKDKIRAAIPLMQITHYLTQPGAKVEPHHFAAMNDEMRLSSLALVIGFIAEEIGADKS